MYKSYPAILLFRHPYTWSTTVIPTHGVLPSSLHMEYYCHPCTWSTTAIPVHGVLLSSLHMEYYRYPCTWRTTVIPAHGGLPSSLHMEYYRHPCTWSTTVISTHGVLPSFHNMIVTHAKITFGNSSHKGRSPVACMVLAHRFNSFVQNCTLFTTHTVLSVSSIMWPVVSQSKPTL